MFPETHGLKIFMAAVVAAVAICCFSAPAPAQSTKASVEELAEELGLTFVQIMDLKTVFDEYAKKKVKLVEAEAHGTSAEELIEKRQRLQREFYEELSRVLTPEQIVKYKEFIMRDHPENGGSPIISKRPDIKKGTFAWIDAMRWAADQVVMSGLQKQALVELIEEMESHAAKMYYLDSGYKPEEDVELVGRLQTKIMWIMLPDQHRNFIDAMAATDIGSGGRKPETPAGNPGAGAPESGVE